MSDRAPTPEQATAIVAEDRAVMVEAGAGSGKTGVMVDRYCRLVCDEELPLEEVLTITFTEKAAAELRQRIRAALLARATTGDERARKLAADLGGAWITTIHGFCHRLISAHSVAAGVDPRFAVLDEAETQRAAREAFDQALEEFLSGEHGAEGEETLAAYGIDSLRGMVVGAHEELRSRGFARPELAEPPTPDAVVALARAREAAEDCLAELGERSRGRSLAERALEVLATAGEEIGLDAVAALRDGGSAQEMLAYREAMDAAIARVAEHGEGGAAYRHAAELLLLFGRRFAGVKERRGGIDFEDMQLLATALLEKPELGAAYRDRFSHLMVDEFQDTNRLQVRLIEALRGSRTKLMVVGDALQSIYGFRHADLDAYRDQRRAFASDPQSEVIELSGNFRSRPEVVGAVNEIGAALIGEDYRPLRVGALPESEAPPGGGPAVELLLTARKGWEDLDLEPAVDSSTQPHYLAEARFLAERLRELAEEDGVPRGEMVVLLRASTHLDAYEDSLERAGLRPYVVGGRGYWSHQQVSDVCSLLAVLANPLDDRALFGALASPACGVSPDTLWLLRAAAGPDRHVWPAVERVAGTWEPELAEAGRLEAIPPVDAERLARFVAVVVSLRRRGTRLPLADLIDRAIAETGYDLAVLGKPAGESRQANVRKLMRIAEEFEAREGRDLRGLLDFLAFREEADDEAAAATAAEDHDGVRIMSVHRAKGLEFGVVAVPHLDRSLLAGAWPPLLTFGRAGDERVGMQLRRLGAKAINIYDHAALREETLARDAEEGLRLFHVAATRARERLILSGVVKEKGAGEIKDSTSVVERIVEALDIDRAEDSQVTIPPPQARLGLDATFEPSTMRVQLSRPSAERAAELVRRGEAPREAADAGEGPAPLLARRAPSVPRRPLSYSAISQYEECGYRFQLERVFGFGREVAAIADLDGDRASPSAREERTARGRAVHALLEWSHANGWAPPPAELLAAHAKAEHLDSESLDGLGDAVGGWLGSELLAERIRPAPRARAEVPFLIEVDRSVLRGSIDLLVEDEDGPPLVVDYKTDRLGETGPAERAADYEIQRSIYAMAAADGLGTDEIEVAYVFLERPDEPQVERLGPAELEAAVARTGAAVARIGAGDFPVAAIERRSEELCRGCPARGRVCSGPARSS